MDLKLPNLGEGADSGTVVNLFVKEGDRVSKGQPVLELENEKAVATIPSSAAGAVTRVYVKPGDKLSVGQPILSLEDAGSTASPPALERGLDKAIQTPSPGQQPRLATQEAEAQGAEEGTAAPPAAAPSIRKLARDLGLDLTRVRGSARGGRIVLEDVRAHIQQLQRLAAAPKGPGPAATPGPKPPAAGPIDFSKWGPVSRKPLSALRQVIARRMSENWRLVPRVTQFDEADITELMELRKRYAPACEQQGARLTLTSFALRVVADTLKKHPIFNSSLDEAAQEIVFKDYYHIGVAVDTEAGLIVPVIRDVDRKGLIELSKELEDLARKARERKVSAEELKGGTFTISNQGGVGGAHFTPILNWPEVAILGLGRGAAKAVVLQNRVQPRLMLPLGLSYDHRIIDGAAAARFIVDLVRAFENFQEEAVKPGSA